MTDPWDPDIAALDLTPAEKNGLQVYRNYSTAFQRHRAERFVQQLDAQTYDVGVLSRVLGHIAVEEGRAVPVIACAFADEVMLAMLRREVPNGVPGGKAALFSGFGALGRLSSRLQVCYAFGWLDQHLLEELDGLRKIRNDISHKWDVAALKDRIEQFVQAGAHPVEEAFDDSGRVPEAFYKLLDPIGRLRLRVIWILGRVFYECLTWVPVLKEGLPPHATLYLKNRPKLLTQIADECMKASRCVVGSC